MKAGSLEILEKAQLPPDQARAILAAMEFELASHDTDLVRKGELHSLEVRMEREFGELRGEIKAQGTRYVLWMFSMFVAFSGLILGVLGRGH